MQGFSQNPIMALLANLRRPQIYDGNPFQMAGQQQAEAQVDAVGAPPPAPAQAPAPPSPQRDRPGTPARRPSLWRALSSGLVDGGIAAGMDREEARIAGLDARDAAANTLRVRAEAFRASVGEDGQFNPQAYLRAHADAGIPIDPTDIKSLLETGRPNFNDVTVGNIRYRVGEDGQYTEVARDSTPDWRKGPDRNGDGEEDWFNANPGPPASSPRPGTPPSSGIVPPELLQGAKPLNPTSAAPSGAATPQGQRFGNRAELRDFVSQQIPGARFTSGYRTQAEQDALVRRGVTKATRSAHTYAGGQDIVPNLPFSQWEAEAERLRATGRFRKVIIETGVGRNQGTAPHIHLEPR
jgi:hypothetical protein